MIEIPKPIVHEVGSILLVSTLAITAAMDVGVTSVSAYYLHQESQKRLLPTCEGIYASEHLTSYRAVVGIPSVDGPAPALEAVARSVVKQHGCDDLLKFLTDNVINQANCTSVSIDRPDAMSLVLCSGDLVIPT